MTIDASSAVFQTVSQLVAGMVMVAIAYIKMRDHITSSAVRSEELYRSLEEKFDQFGRTSDATRVEALRTSIQKTADDIHRRVIEDAEARHSAMSDLYDKNIRACREQVVALEKILNKNKCHFDEEAGHSHA